MDGLMLGQGFQGLNAIYLVGRTLLVVSCKEEVGGGVDGREEFGGGDGGGGGGAGGVIVFGAEFGFGVRRLPGLWTGVGDVGLCAAPTEFGVGR
ncbi:hypothetical protein J437_LFUL013128 [Ladona fulva]|uniref:Uncharacterized protein n=1 Tax=Ladona fulva TaxID=123851 RepID=A0A8K0KE91_LADFU|nr:hypothetical protein J437_LFUL013128 [Ladona fulva]